MRAINIEYAVKVINFHADEYGHIIQGCRTRIGHSQHLRPSDIPRFKELNVIVSVRSYHYIDDGRWTEKRIGRDRVQTVYALAFRLLIDGSEHYVKRTMLHSKH